MIFNQQIESILCISSYNSRLFLFHNENHENQQLLISWIYLFISFIFSIYDINDNNKKVKNPRMASFCSGLPR